MNRLAHRLHSELRAARRVLNVSAHLGLGLLIGLGLGVVQPQRLADLKPWWHARLCHLLGVRVQVRGHLAQQGLLVANHVSWLDISLLGALGELRFIAKDEVRRWPLIGRLARLSGTLFITRGAHQSAALTRSMHEHLARGQRIVLFPEGTTTDGRSVGHFYPRLFAAARQSGAPLQPLAIRYRCGDDPHPDPSAAYLDADTLLASLVRIARHPNLVAEVQCLALIHPDPGQGRNALAKHSQKAILNALEPTGVTVSADALPPLSICADAA